MTWNILLVQTLFQNLVSSRCVGDKRFWCPRRILRKWVGTRLRLKRPHIHSHVHYECDDENERVVRHIVRHHVDDSQRHHVCGQCRPSGWTWKKQLFLDSNSLTSNNSATSGCLWQRCDERLCHKICPGRMTRAAAFAIKMYTNYGVRPPDNRPFMPRFSQLFSLTLCTWKLCIFPTSQDFFINHFQGIPRI